MTLRHMAIRAVAFALGVQQRSHHELEGARRSRGHDLLGLYP
jgi:hypothetical protein